MKETTFTATAADLIVGDQYRYYYQTHNVNMRSGVWTPVQDCESGTVGSIETGKASMLNPDREGRILITTIKRRSISLAPNDVVTIIRNA